MSAADPKGYWLEDHLAKNCMQCNAEFSLFKRRHHCRWCGKVRLLANTPCASANTVACHGVFPDILFRLHHHPYGFAPTGWGGSVSYL